MLSVIPSLFQSSRNVVIYHLTNTCMSGPCNLSLILSLYISFASNMHSADGQRALLYMRSVSSNSNPISCRTMKWRGQCKTIMNIGSMKTDWASQSLAKVCFLKGWHNDKAIHCSCWLAREATTEGSVDLVRVGKCQICALWLQVPGGIVFSLDLA